MATIAPAVLQPGIQLTAVAAIMYTVPPNTKVVIKRAVFTNTDTAARTITVYRVPSGGSPGVTNIIINAYPLSAGQDYSPVSLTNMSLAVGESIQAKADSAGVVNCFLTGVTA